MLIESRNRKSDNLQMIAAYNDKIIRETATRYVLIKHI